MPGPVGDSAHQRPRAVDERQDACRDLPVRELARPAYVVNLADRTTIEDESDRISVIVHEEPVALLSAVAVEREWLIVEGIGDEQRYDLLRMLVRAVGVRSARNQGVDAVSHVVRVDKQLTSGLGRRIRA